MMFAPRQCKCLISAEHSPLLWHSSGEHLAEAIMTAGHWQQGHTQAVEEQTLCTSQSCSPQLPKPGLGMLLAGVGRVFRGSCQGCPTNSHCKPFLATSALQRLKVWKFQFVTFLNYWCQTPQPPLLTVFLATGFHL